MNTDINKMFQEKNKEILKNSLVLEMERNLEALKTTTDNCVALEINKLIIFLESYFKENSIKYKKEELIGFLFREKTLLNNIINSKIEDKKQNLKNNFLSKQIDDDILRELYIKDYYEFLLQETKKMNEELELLLKTEICTKFSTELLKKYKMSNIDQKERINSRINVLFKDRIISRIKEEISFRDESLKNMCQESYNRYLELNKQTTT